MYKGLKMEDIQKLKSMDEEIKQIDAQIKKLTVEKNKTIRKMHEFRKVAEENYEKTISDTERKRKLLDEYSIPAIPVSISGQKIQGP